MRQCANKWTIFALNMRMTKRTTTCLLIFLLPFFMGIVFAQDTVSVFFEFGKSKLKRSQFQVLNTIVNRFDLSTLDSVQYIGMSDSVGNIRSNLKLSQQRASNVSEFCAGIFQSKIPFRIYALGEKPSTDAQKSRRVDVVLFFKAIDYESQEPVELAVDKKGCYYIDYKIIYSCHIYTITKQKKKYVVLEQTYFPKAPAEIIEENQKRLMSLYYGSLDKNKKFLVKKVRWKEKITGRLWWKAMRYQAIIPKKDFDQFKIFQIKPKPCTDCQFAQKFDSIPKITHESNCFYPDPVVMTYLQYKTIGIKQRKALIRVPREFIDSSLKYYSGLPSWSSTPILWKSKRSKRKQNYLYAEVLRRGEYLPSVYRSYTCLPDTNCNNFGRFGGQINCMDMSGDGSYFKLYAETGIHIQQQGNVPYIALGLTHPNYNSRYEYELLAGLHSELTFYAAARARFNLFQFNTKKLQPENGWQSAKHFYSEYRKKWEFNIYSGMELKTSLGKSSYQYLEHNLHLGISMKRYGSYGSQRLFLQGGMGYDLMDANRLNFYPIVQVGYMFILR